VVGKPGERRRGEGRGPGQAHGVSRWTAPGRGAVERGQALVEAALTLPMLLIVALALVQFALFVHARHVVTAAVQDGARVAAGAGNTTSDGLRHAEAILRAGLGRDAQGVTLQPRETDEVVVMEAEGYLAPIIPWVGSPGLPLRGRAEISKERFRADLG
jgi:hypothetical protein